MTTSWNNIYYSGSLSLNVSFSLPGCGDGGSHRRDLALQSGERAHGGHAFPGLLRGRPISCHSDMLHPWSTHQTILKTDGENAAQESVYEYERVLKAWLPRRTTRVGAG